MRSPTITARLSLPAAVRDRVQQQARAARDGDPAARNELFHLLTEPIRLALYRRRRLALPLEPDERTSETFLALADTLAAWSGDDFPTFFAAEFGRYLWRRLAAHRWPGRGVVPLAEWATAPDPEAALATNTIELAAGLSAAQRVVLLALARGVPTDLAAADWGVCTRTAQRRYRALAAALRTSDREHSAPAQDEMGSGKG